MAPYSKCRLACAHGTHPSQRRHPGEWEAGRRRLLRPRATSPRYLFEQRRSQEYYVSVKVVADGQELVHAGFRVILNSEPDIEVVGEAGDGREATRIIAIDPEKGSRVLILTTFGLDE